MKRLKLHLRSFLLIDNVSNKKNQICPAFVKSGIFINGKLHVKVLKVSNNKYIEQMVLCKNIYAVDNLTESYVTEPVTGRQNHS